MAAATPEVVAVKAEEPMQQLHQKIEPQSDEEDDRAGGQGDIQPVGHDYVEEVQQAGNKQRNDHNN